MKYKIIGCFVCFFGMTLKGSTVSNDAMVDNIQKLNFVQDSDSVEKEAQKLIENDFTRLIPAPIKVYACHVSIAPVKKIDKSGFYSMAVALAIISHVKKNYSLSCKASFDDMQKDDWIIKFKDFWKFSKEKQVSDMSMYDILTFWNDYKCGFVKKTIEDQDQEGLKKYRLKRLPMSFLNVRGEEVREETVTVYAVENTAFTEADTETFCEYETQPLGESLLPFITYPSHEHIFIVNTGGNCFPLVVIQNKKDERSYYFADPLRDENRIITNKPVSLVSKNAFKVVDFITHIEEKIAYIQS